jgi:hypothetical protein
MQTISLNTTGEGAARTAPFGAFAFFAATLTALVLLAHHPVAAGARSVKEKLDLIVQLGAADQVVHAVLIAAVAALLYGAIELSRALGRDRPSVAMGLASYGTGCVFLFGAMLLDGFVTPDIAARFAGGADGVLQAASVSFLVIWSCIQVLTKAGLLSMGLGMLFWSAACRGRQRAVALAILGLVAGFLPPVVVILTGMRVQPHSLMLLAAAQGAWNVAAGVFLWRNAHASRSEG